MTSSFQMVYEILEGRMRRDAAAILILTLVSALADTGSVAIIIPVIQVTLDPAAAIAHPYLGRLYALLGSPGTEAFVIYVCVIMVLFFVLKNIIALALLWSQQYFIARNRAVISSEMVHYYLTAPYLLHMNTNIAKIFRNSISAVIDLFNGTVQSLFVILAESFVLIGILALLTYNEPSAALSAGAVIVAAGIAFQIFLKRPITRLGRRTQDAYETSILSFNHAFGSIKEAKVLGREAFFAAEFRATTTAYADRLGLFSALNQSPRMFFEIAGTVGLLFACIVMIRQGRATADMVAMLSMFAMAAFRLLPSLSRLANAAGNLHFNYALTDDLARHLLEYRSSRRQLGDQVTPLRFERDIRFEQVDFRYPDKPQNTLNDISLVISRGQSVAIVGSSGSGKTTLSNILLGLLEPSGGQVLIDGQNLRHNIRNWQRNIGLVTDVVFLTDDTLRRNIAFGRDNEEIDDSRLQQVVKMAQLDDLVAELPDGLNTMAGDHGCRLSGGQRQRVAIARCLYLDLPVLVFDEATSALDAETEASIAASIEALHGNRTLVIIAHRLSTVRNCDRIFFMEQGRLADSGTFQELVDRNPAFHAMVRQMDLSDTMR